MSEAAPILAELESIGVDSPPRAGGLPELDLPAFRGAVTSLANYVSGQVRSALDARDDEQRRYADRSVRHLLSHLPTRVTLERLLAAVAG